jgi:CBS domain-containing protein
MTKTFKTIDSNALAVEAEKIMEENKIFTLVFLEKNKYI